MTVYDCLAGLVKARRFNFFDFGTDTFTDATTNAAAMARRTTGPFDIDEYEYFEQVENGDLNWIVSNKILAFAGPRSQRVTTSDGYCVLTPADYISHFTRWGVKLVIQLNAGGYDPAQFTNSNIRHVKHVYPDGSCPELHTLRAVLHDMENAILVNNSAIAVHCKAGLGRTGTCIGAYIMKHYRLTAEEVIGYMRICRPGMVIGPQQHYLSEIQHLMWQEGDVYHGRGIMDGTLLIGGGKKEDDYNNDNNDEDAKTRSTTLTIASSPSGSGASPTLSIVTPDGRPFRLSTTPVNSARTLDMDTTTPSSPTTTTSSSSSSNTISPTSSSKTSMSLNDYDNYHTRGDQAETLLSRRLDQYQARTTRQRQQQQK